MKKQFILFLVFLPLCLPAQIHTDRVFLMGRNALYYDDYALSIHYFNQVISAKPYLYEPYYYRALAKFYLEDYVGAEKDCSESIDKNPFIAKSYQLRGLCRIKTEHYDGAIADYSAVIRYEPKNQAAWHNRILCRVNKKEFKEATLELDSMLTLWPTYYQAYNIKAQIALEQKDSTQALTLLDRSLRLNDADAQTWAVKGGIFLQKGNYPASDSAYSKAIALQSRDAGFHINRALARYHQKKLRDAMADYDQALHIDPENFLGHYNRGLLRAQVGDDNNAITDFDFVLKRDPEDMLALYNRAVLLEQTGDYRGAIRDYSRVIASYPDFLGGYERRAVCLRKVGEAKKALADERKVYIELIERTYPTAKTANKTTQTRKKRERNIQDYQKIVVDDPENQTDYKDEFRGKIQNKKVEILRQPLYELSIAGLNRTSKSRTGYWALLDKWDRPFRNRYGRIILQTQSTSASSLSIDTLSARIGSLDEALSQKEESSLYMLRALYHSTMHDLKASLQDLDHAIRLDSLSLIAHFQRATANIRLYDMEKRLQQESIKTEKEQPAPIKAGQIILKASLNDLDKVIRQDEANPYAFYNKGCILMETGEYIEAATCFTRAINLDPHMAEAYFNRGLVFFRLQKRSEGFADLSKAGELGIYDAYSVIKQYSRDDRSQNASK